MTPDKSFVTIPSDVAQTYFPLQTVREVTRTEGFATSVNAVSLFEAVMAAQAQTIPVLSDSTHTILSYDHYGNITWETETNVGVDSSTDIRRTFSNDTSNWYVGVPQTQVTCNTALATKQCRALEFGPPNQYGELEEIWTGEVDSGQISFGDGLAAADPHTWLRTGTRHDDYGNVTYTVADDWYGHERAACVSYDDEGVFPYATVNAAGHTTYTSYNRAFGAKSATVDPNGLATQFAYDGLGRLVNIYLPDGTSSSIMASRDKLGGPQGNWWNIKKTVIHGGNGQRTTEYDGAGRAVHTWTPLCTCSSSTTSFCDASSCSTIEQGVDYDSLGNVARVYVPWKTGDPSAGALYHQYDHDLAGRVVLHTTPWNSTTYYAYNVNTNYQNVVTSTDSAGTQTAYVDSLGRTVQVVDKMATQTVYTYAPFNGLYSVTNILGFFTGSGGFPIPFGEVNTTARDAYGRVTDFEDPNRGESTFEYDGFGELTHLHDGAGRDYGYVYDALARRTSETVAFPGVADTKVTTWDYDTASCSSGTGGCTPQGTELGRIHRVTSPDGYVDEYSYDGQSRLSRLAVAGDASLQADFGYDLWGRLDSITYPGGTSPPFVVARDYDLYGHLIGTHDSNTQYWAVNDVDNAGRASLETFGNGTSTSRQYYADKGRVANIMTGVGAAGEWSSIVQSLTYGYDDRLNMTSLYGTCAGGPGERVGRGGFRLRRARLPYVL